MNQKLKLLAQSAFAIPGMIATAHAAGPAATEASYRYSYYSEDDSPAARDDSGGAQDRYKIQVHQFHLLTPLTDKLAVTVEGSYETMAGASPVYTYVPAGEDTVYTHFSGASQEQRYDLNLSGRVYGSTSDLGVGAYVSVERDDLAVSGSVDGSIALNDQMTTVSGGVSGGYDLIEPTSAYEAGSTAQAANEPARFGASGQSKWQVSVFEGVGQIIDMNTVVQANLAFTYKNGYLSDPYRDCPHAENVPCDIRPSTRAIGTLGLGLRKFLPSLNGALHADYRLFVDTWDVASHTVDVDYFQNWAPNWRFFTANDIKFQLSPGIRYYLQSSGYFYEVPDLNDSIGGQVYNTDTSRYYSSDPRLAEYGAIALKTRLRVDFRQFSWVGALERYVANPEFGFNSSDIPGLPTFWRFTTGLDYRF